MSHVHTANGTIHLTRHDRMMGTLSERLALRHGLSPETAGLVRTAASLHDIGKAAIPNSILEKPGKLTDKEFDLMRLHTVCGYNLLRNLSGPHADMARKIAMYHHERYDGQGYWGMENEIQPIYVKIAALSDVFTALISKRPYNPNYKSTAGANYAHVRYIATRPRVSTANRNCTKRAIQFCTGMAF